MFNVEEKVGECEGKHQQHGDEGEAHKAQVLVFTDRVPAAKQLIGGVSSPK